MEAISLFRRRLLAWYVKHARDLPWRHSRDAYRVWLSEVMLQQTQVETVRAYFERFVTAWPTAGDLAAADEQQVLRAWEGLGYYRRARNLHAAAKRVVAEHHGKFPCDVPGLMALPGVGRYTAGAIASIAYDRPAPIVEANTARLYARLIALREPMAGAAGQRALWALAEQLVPRRGAGRFNQALMELGALVCTPERPSCDRCPVASHCKAKLQQITSVVPVAKRRPAVTELREAAVVVRRGGDVLLRQCGPAERWAGLWDFPRFAVEAEGPLFAADELVAGVERLTGVVCGAPKHRATLRHAVTRFRIKLDCYHAERRGGRVRSSDDWPVKWAPAVSLPDVPLSVTGRKIAEGLGDSMTGVHGA